MSLASRFRLDRIRLDISPLRTSRDFRWLFASGLITFIGSMITYVALPFQIKELTGSYIAVGLIAAVELVPMIIFGLYGGALADFVDRKRMVWVTEAGRTVLSLGLLLNALSPNPRIWVIYVISALFAAVDALQRPSMQALIPRIVRHDQLPAASALSSVRWQVGAIVGPAIGGLIIAGGGVASAYAVDVASFLISLALLAQLRPVPALPDANKPSLAGIVEGLKYAASRQDLMGTYIVDLVAMLFAFPTALYPFWADKVGGPSSLGLLYSAGTVGALLATITSGWVSRYRYHGRAIIIAAIFWGVGIALAGVVDNLAWVLFFLAVAGGADMISGLMRTTIWNQTIPDELRGRLAGIEMLSYLIGPLGGQMRAGFMASWMGLRIAIVGGGVLCIAGVAAVASVFPKFRNYDVETNPLAIRERQLRSERASNNESGD
jgi:MFS family permease